LPSLYDRLKQKEASRPRTAGAAAPGRTSLVQVGVRPQPAPVENPAAVALRELKYKIQKRLIQEMDARLLVNTREMTDQQRWEVRQKIAEAIEEEEGVPPLERETVLDELYAEIIGFGPIQPLLDDPTVTEIMVNSATQVYVERNGKLQRTDVQFASDEHVLQVIEKIVAPLGRRIDEASPMVDARLPDGSRVNAIIPPLAIKGPSITIRKFARTPITMDNLVEWSTLTRPMALFLEACVRARLNIVVSGGTGSGKTTNLNILSSFIPNDERIVTIEDAAELQLRQEHVVSLEARPPNLEGRGGISIRQLVRNALRMRPDRIVVGECRGGEALDMLQAMNTGHDGSLTTLHANSPRDMISRLETMVLMAGMDLPIRAIREQIASAIDLIVQSARLKDGSRKITHITEVQGMEGDVVVLQDLFLFHQTGVTPDGRVVGYFASTGIRPKFWERLLEQGIELPEDLFEV